MAAAPLPAARQITRPFGGGRRWAASTTSGWAAATAASKMARSRGRRSVIGCRLSIRLAKKKTPAKRACGGEASTLKSASAADVAGDHVAEQLPPLALEPLQLKLVDRGEIGRRGVDRDAGQQHLGTKILQVR